MTVFEARCWGGPLDGKWYAADRSHLEAVEPIPSAIGKWWDMSPTTEIGIRRRRYQYERVVFGPMVFGPMVFAAWVIDGPPERVEAVKDTILGGLHTVWVWGQLAGR
jgi:hypothetical protein